GAARSFSKSIAIAKLHGDVADAHFRTRALCAKGNGNTFVGLNVQDEAIGFNLFFAEDDVRGAAELDHDLRAACGEALAGAKIERNASPAPVVDQQFGGNESFGLGRRIHVELFAVAGHELTVELSRRILPANDLLSDHPQIER